MESFNYISVLKTSLLSLNTHHMENMENKQHLKTFEDISLNDLVYTFNSNTGIMKQHLPIKISCDGVFMIDTECAEMIFENRTDCVASQGEGIAMYINKCHALEDAIEWHSKKISEYNKEIENLDQHERS